MPSTSHSKCHFLLVPLPEHGHANPMLCLGSHLAAMGCTVTFVKAEKAPFSTVKAHVGRESNPETEIIETGRQAGQIAHLPVYQHALRDANCDDARAHKDTPAAQEDSHVSTNASECLNGNNMPLASNGTNVRFWTLPYVGGPAPLTDTSSRFEILKHTLASLEERQEMVEKLVQESEASTAPIYCIICDILLCNWVMNVAERHKIPAAALLPTCGVNFYMPYAMVHGKREDCETLRQRFSLPERKEPTEAGEMEKIAEVRRAFMRGFDRVEEASHVLVNSFEQLEVALLESLKTSELNFKFIGPCLPAWEAGDVAGEVDKTMLKQAGCHFTADHTCLQWLDRQEKGSVLYVSFGSEVNVEKEQAQELALGIEASGHRFLWVVRPGAPPHNLPQEEFCKRTRDIGIFVAWAPQRKVLQHTAVGGFLTHCGWNSTLESMMFGVPMLCFPLNGDQFLNAQLIEMHWKVGLRLGPPHALVCRAEVERAVRDLLSSDDLRNRIAQLKEMARLAVFDSQISITAFVQDIITKSNPKLPDKPA